MKHKWFNGIPITKLMRSFWKAGWSSQQQTTFFVKAGIDVSTTTINNERYKWKNGEPAADLTERDWDAISEVVGKEFVKPSSKPREDDDNDDKPSKPLTPSVDLSKLTHLLSLIKDELGAKLDVLEAKMLEQDSKIQQIEEIALATSKKIEVTLPDGEQFDLDETAHPALKEVIAMLTGMDINGTRERINVCLIGPAGSGKTFLAGQAARILKCKFGFISCSAGMSESHLLGRLIPIGSDGAFTYVPTEFVTIYEEGGLWLFDEMDASDQNMMVVLNAALDGKQLSLPNRHKKPYAKKHRDCMLMGACNTFGTGADRMYVGRNQQDEAFLDRFRAGQVELDYDPALEAKLCPDGELRERLQKYRENCRKGQVRRVISTRFLKQAYMLKKMGFEDERIDKALFGGWTSNEVQKAKGGF